MSVIENCQQENEKNRYRSQEITVKSQKTGGGRKCCNLLFTKTQFALITKRL
jgi:hypothetical protein